MRTVEGNQTEAISNLEEKREIKPGSVCLQVLATVSSPLSSVRVHGHGGSVVCEHTEAIFGLVRCSTKTLIWVVREGASPSVAISILDLIIYCDNCDRLLYLK